MKELTKKELIEQHKKEIIESGYPSHEAYTDDRYYTKRLIGTMYIKEVMDYGFHIFFIHEPNINDKLAGVNGTISEMFYDLRNRVYWIKRNFKDVLFSPRNVDCLFPYKGDSRVEIFNKLSTDKNEGLYDTAFRFLSKMGMEKLSMYGRFFHRLITEHSYFELLYKANITVNSDLKIRNRTGTSPREILGLSKTQWKMINKYGCNQKDMSYRDNDQADIKAIAYLAYIESLNDEYGLDKLKTFESKEFPQLYSNSNYTSSALRIAKQHNLPEKKFIRYIYFECDVSQGMTVGIAISQYDDYIRMTTEMGYERFDRYPKHLKTAHDIASRNYKIRLNAEELVQWNSAYEVNNQFDSTYGDYKVLAPVLPEDLVREGNTLGHCVGSYVGKVRKGISAVLFLRAKDDIETPLVTIEVRDNRITQARGKMNYPPTPQQKLAINKFAKKFDLAI